VRSLAGRWPLGVASSSPRSLIETVLATADLSSAFAAVVSSEEVPRGKPAPDVYLAAADRLSAAPTACAAVEDSSNGLRAAAAAGLTVIAIPRPEYPPAADALASARLVLPSLNVLTPHTIEALA
jgi:beta-phosphoglucomutase-like phosphatase (HAD superfamily)